MALDKYINQLDQLQTLKDTDLITIGRASDGRLFQCTIAQLKAVLPSTGVNGKSAYEIAISRGYTGTLSQWLESLKGQPGQPGQPGQIGEPGPVGIGTQGPKGDPGNSDLKEFVGTICEPILNLLYDEDTPNHFIEIDTALFSEVIINMLSVLTDDKGILRLHIIGSSTGLTLSFNGPLIGTLPTGSDFTFDIKFFNQNGNLTYQIS